MKYPHCQAVNPEDAAVAGEGFKTKGYTEGVMSPSRPDTSSSHI
ncbi:hypothetical protein ACFLXY_00345 [Chloroflexota bacterium]